MLSPILKFLKNEIAVDFRANAVSFKWRDKTMEIEPFLSLSTEEKLKGRIVGIGSLIFPSSPSQKVHLYKPEDVRRCGVEPKDLWAAFFLFCIKTLQKNNIIVLRPRVTVSFSHPQDDLSGYAQKSTVKEALMKAGAREVRFS